MTRTSARSPRVANPGQIARFAACAVLLALATLVSLTTPSLAAQQQTPEELRQQAEQMLGRDLSNQEILDMLRQSGLSA